MFNLFNIMYGSNTTSAPKHLISIYLSVLQQHHQLTVLNSNLDIFTHIIFIFSQILFGSNLPSYVDLIYLVITPF